MYNNKRTAPTIILICILIIALIGCNKNTQSDSVADVEVEKNEEAKQYYMKAVQLHQKGHNDEALKAYDQAIQFDADYAEAYLGKAILLTELGHLDDAITFYDSATRSDPYSANAYYEKGRVLYSMKEYDKAIETLDKAINLNPNYSDAYFSKGIVYRELQQYDKALQALNKAIELDEMNTLAYINKAQSLQRQKKYTEAIQTLDTAIERVSNDDSLYYEKAIAYSLMKNYKDAIKSLAKSIELNPNNVKFARNDETFSGLEPFKDFQELLGNQTPSSESSDDTNNTMDENPVFKFNLEDLYVQQQPILYVSYEDIISRLGQPIKMDSYQVRMPGTDDYNYFITVSYEAFDLEFIFYDELLKEPNPQDSVKRFDITRQNIELACGLEVGMTVDEVIHQFGKREVYNLDPIATTGYEASAINHILTSYKPDNYYSQYTQAMYMDMDYENIQPNEVFSYMGLVLLIKENKVDRIVLGYPNLP